MAGSDAEITEKQSEYDIHRSGCTGNCCNSIACEKKEI
jgi:hypothetical protein